MNNKISQSSMENIIRRIIEYANETIKEKENNSEFIEGKRLAYHEVLGVIQNEFISEDIDLSIFGLDIDLDKVL